MDLGDHAARSGSAPDTMTERSGSDGGGLWDLVQQAAYLKTSSLLNCRPVCATSCGMSDFYLANGKQFELHRGQTSIQAITHYGRMRHDWARTARRAAPDPPARVQRHRLPRAVHAGWAVSALTLVRRAPRRRPVSLLEICYRQQI